MASFTTSTSLHFFYLALKSMANSINPDQSPVGFRFNPTDEELINHYLKYKVSGKESSAGYIIPEIDICKNEPWLLPGLLQNDTGMEEWFFFSALDFKYSKSRRCNRITETGYWKSTGKDREIRARGTNKLIGTKKIMVFHCGRVPNGKRTDWVIHEYRLLSDTNFAHLRPFVICRLKNKSDKKVSKFDKPNGLVNSTSENVSTLNGIQEVQALKSPGQPALPDSQLTNRLSIQREATENYCNLDSDYQLMRNDSDEYFHGEVWQLLRPGPSDSESNFRNCLNSVSENKNSDEVTSKICIDNSQDNQKLRHGISPTGKRFQDREENEICPSEYFELQSGREICPSDHIVLQSGRASRDTSDDETFVGQNIRRRISPTGKRFQDTEENELQSGSTEAISVIILFLFSSVFVFFFLLVFLFVSKIIQVSLYVLRLISRDNRLALLIITLVLFQPLILIV